MEEIVKSSGNYIAIDKGIFNEESMKIKANDSNRIIGMSKTLEDNEYTFVSIDIYAFDSRNRDKIFQIASDIINSGELNSWTEVAIDLLSKDESSNLKYLDMTGKKWMEIDNHDDLRKAEEIFN